MAFITFGFSIAKAFEFLHETQGTHAPLPGARSVGILMVAIGIVALALASIQHRRAINEIRRECPGLPISHASVLADCSPKLALRLLSPPF